MSVSPKGNQTLGVLYGIPVTGGAKSLPAGTSGDIFTVAGGRVIVTSLIGKVTTAIQNQACTLSVGNNPTGGSPAATAICGATAITNAALGIIVAAPLAIASALVVSANPGILAPSELQTVFGGNTMVDVGTVNVTTSATNTGAITWTITYIPYDVGAYVTAL